VNPADGRDHILTLKHGATTLMTIRIAGRAFRPGQDPEAYAHNGFIAASSVGLAFHAGEGLAKRRSPINFVVEDSFVSTGRHAFDVRNSSYKDRFPGVAPGQSADLQRKQGAIDQAVQQLSGPGGFSTDGRQTGVFVTGLFGNLKGSKFSDFFDVPDLEAGEDLNDVRYATTVDAGAGLNIGLFGKGDHGIRGMTYVDIQGGEQDINYIHVRNNVGAPAWDLHGDASLSTFNPKVYVNVVTPGGTTLLDNGVEDGPMGKEDPGGDDSFTIQSGTVTFTNPLDPDRPATVADDAIAPADVKTEFDTLFKGIGERVREKEDSSEEKEGDDYEIDPLAEAEYYTQMKNEQDSIFAEFEAYWESTK
ncbi:MAG: hypothetical protein HY543_05805, partial [Deltaproteobacteria bacterium]|nr:hypothetical protein [Deltaproteobacteria bacterium]